jgi:hypothetical protein
MAFYDEMAALALEMLAEFGTDAQLISSGPVTASFDKATGRPKPSTPTTKTLRVVTGPREVLDEEARRVVRTVATLLVEPRRGDKLVIAGQPLVVCNVTVIAPVGTPIVCFAEVA